MDSLKSKIFWVIFIPIICFIFVISIITIFSLTLDKKSVNKLYLQEPATDKQSFSRSEISAINSENLSNTLIKVPSFTILLLVLSFSFGVDSDIKCEFPS